MNEYIVILVFLLWYTLSLVISETFGKKRKIGIQLSFFVCMIFSPILGMVITIMSKKITQ